MRQVGKIVKVLAGAGYLFIREDGQRDGNDCFMSLASWPIGIALPTVGLRVTFEAEGTPRGPRVTSIVALSTGV